MTDTQNLLENRPPSLATHFLQRVEATPDKEAYRYPVPPASGTGPDDWRPLTWRESADRVFAIAAGLIDLGIRPEERVALASATRVEWILADLGVLCAGAATTTVYPTTNADETSFILSDSGSRVLIAEDAAQLTKVRAQRDELPELAHVVVIRAEDAVPAEDDPEGWVLSLAELEKRGTALLESRPDVVRERMDALRGDQLATLIYTSGTTGRPKGVRLAHDSWSYMAIVIGNQDGLLYADDVQYLWLPLAHVFGKVLTAGQIYVGHTTAVDGRVDKIIDNLPVVRPTYMCAVPRIFEKVYNGVAQRAREGGAAQYKIFQWAAEVSRQYARTSQDNFRRTGTASVPFGLRAQHAVADKLVYAKLREAFGGRLRAAVSGSAALAPDIGYFFAGAGINILEGYGLTESSAASFLNPEDYRTGTVGKAFPGLEVRFAEDGEVLLRGPGIMQGYHGLPELTAQVLESDGWFHTGDIGELSPDGYLRITDRKKDLIKTSGGKYVAPAEVEGQFKAVCPFVSNILVHGADRNYCTALIALDEPTIMKWAADHGLAGKSYADVVATDEVRELIDGYVRRLNEGLQRWQTIKKFRLLPRDLDVEHGELTPSLKLKRPVVEREYKDLIEDMYAGAREV
ncbi:long-chain fatty acid--CoA ligase [Streptomyces samsunensis]|uniref:Long-chain fatty acid--CoA ligase n=1 Tax=Streptomyces autolyticus TaxID=75293 RepID=A0ABM6HCS6_9ACTN|nr:MULTISPECIES: long-chain fatty acid--CoA ligase [Streptomyces]MYU17347.1 AMP-binding protein [Streptomyces sp. SID8361]MYX60732.1 AMP-binding protein [Streptomyces sp. SID8382]AQA11811.1 long-chain fatty acid--CoA ligase [Streptomyces autolyticus]AUA13890.1 Long-chain-fatty-acid--CoA ligase FadD15 [Streptomyces sp. M56]NUH44065.1 long-chain fatty acid--CoA ligase [Streptomyces samsunensis]